jgi:hypothetical protein
MNPGGIFLDRRQIMSVVYYPKPELGVVHEYTRDIPVRVTLRPGWSSELARVPCKNCSEYNFVSMKMYVPYISVCQSRPEQYNVFASARAKGVVDEFPVETHAREDEIIFWTSTNTRLPLSFRSSLFRKPVTVCFYEDRHRSEGIAIGSVVFDYDGGDSEALIMIILMAIVFFPLFAVVSAVCTASKMKRVHERLRDIREAIQGRQLEQELLQLARAHLVPQQQ